MRMSLRQFLAEGRLRPHRTNRPEIRNLLRVVDRNLRDAAVEAISEDLRFQTAYGAALQLGTIVLAAAGYRTHGEGHHRVTFGVLAELLGDDFQQIAEYFEQARGLRNRSQYDQAGNISEGDATELFGEAKRFRGDVLAWLRRSHPSLVPR